MHYNGLTDAQAEESRKQFGTNALTDVPPEPLWKKLLKGFCDPMILILLVAFAIQIVLFFFHQTEWYEPVGILIAILIANGVAAVFENKQEGKASALKHEANAGEMAKVFRNGNLQEIHADDVVVNDLIFLQAGDKISADGILIEGELHVDQAALNGESEEALKTTPPSPAPEINTKDLLNPHYAYRGTVVCSGEACLKVAVNGDRTVFGQAALEAQSETRATPLQLKLGKLAKQISTFGYIGAALIILMIFLSAICSGNAPANASGWLHLCITAITVAVTIIVCAVPEGLPMLSSLLQALQGLKMIKDNVLVRKINGLETSGSLSLLYSDKTGTITEGRLSVVELLTGDLKKYQKLQEFTPALQQAIRIGVGVNNSAIYSNGNVFGGNNTDRALMSFLAENQAAENISRDNVKEFSAFDSAKKYSSITMEDETGAQVTYFKGAAERLLALCHNFLAEDGTVKKLENNDALAAYLDSQSQRSMRLLAVTKAANADPTDREMTLVCLLSIRDNVRPEARQAIQEIAQAGIQVIMVTGDRKETAVAIAKDAHLITSDNDLAITSFELAEKSDDEVKGILSRLRVVARALPMDKSRLVRLAQELDLVVGMTGDGVNDAPALRKADVGFAMGSGTEVAKEAGEITILDDNLASIEKGILYGRTMFKSIRKFLIFQLTVNVAAVLICAIAPLLGYEKVMTVIQLLLVNLAMDTLAAIAFGSEPPLREYMQEMPIPRQEGIITRQMMSQVLLCGTYIILLCLGMLCWKPLQNFLCITPGNPLYLRSAVFAAFMMAITFNGFSARTAHLNPLNGISQNTTFLVIMGLLLICQYCFITFGGSALEVTKLSCATWLRCALVAFAVVPLDILRKLFTHHDGRQNTVQQ